MNNQLSNNALHLTKALPSVASFAGERKCWTGRVKAAAFVIAAIGMSGCDAFMRVSTAVTDTAEKSLRGATVVLSADGAGRDLITYTDENGLASESLTYGLGSPARVLTVRMTGFKTFATKLELKREYRCAVRLARISEIESSSGRCA